MVVLLGDVGSRRDLDPDLRLYLKQATVLQWGDRLFWEKLRYALPDVRRPRRQQHNHLNGSVGAGKRQLSQLSQLSQLTQEAAFSPDNSFRYETYGPRRPLPQQPLSSTFQHTMSGNLSHFSSAQPQRSSLRSGSGSGTGGSGSGAGGGGGGNTGSGSSGAGSGTYASVGTPDEQDSTRTMTIHI